MAAAENLGKERKRGKGVEISPESLCDAKGSTGRESLGRRILALTRRIESKKGRVCVMRLSCIMSQEYR